MLSVVRVPVLSAVLLVGSAWTGAVRGAAQSAEPEGNRDKTAEPAPGKKAPSPAALEAMKEGVEAMRRHDWKAAASSWQQAVSLEPGNAGAWANLGRVQLQLQDSAAAITSLEKAVALQPALSEAWVALGMACDRAGAPLRAISCLTRAAHEAPADAKVRNHLAISLKNYGWTAAAESELQKALDLDPAYAEAHFNLALMCLEHTPPSLEMARRHYEAARELGAEKDAEVESRLAAPAAVSRDNPSVSGAQTPGKAASPAASGSKAANTKSSSSKPTPKKP